MDHLDLNEEEEVLGFSPDKLRNSGDAYIQFYTFGLPAFAIIGTILNLSVLIIFSHKTFGSSCGYYVRVLALADTLFLITRTLMYCPEYMFQYIHSETSSHTNTIPVLFIRIYPIMEIAQILVTIYTLILMIDHYIFEYKARKHISLIGKETAQKCVFTALGVVVVSHIPNMFKLKTRTVTIDGVPRTDVCLSTLYLINIVRIYSDYIDPILCKFIPAFLIVCVCLALVIKVIIRKRNGGDAGELDMYRGGRSVSSTVSIGVLRAVTVLPYLVITVVHSLKEGEANANTKLLPCIHYTSDIKFENLSPSWELVMVVAGALNSSCKFFVYLAFHSQFRALVWRYLTCRGRRSTKKTRFTPRSRNVKRIVNVAQNIELNRRSQPTTPSLPATEPHLTTVSDNVVANMRESTLTLAQEEPIFFTKGDANGITSNQRTDTPPSPEATPCGESSTSQTGSAPWADSRPV